MQIPLGVMALIASTAFATRSIGSPCRRQPTPTCTPTSGAGDDAPAIMSAIAACPTGTILIPHGTTYTLGSQLSFTGCSGCTLQLEGTLLVTTNFTYWNNRGAVIYLDKLSGANVISRTGTGVLNGQGQAAWDYIKTAAGASYKRPTLVEISRSTDVDIVGFTVLAAPSGHFSVNGQSANVYLGNLTLYSVSSSSNVAHNTDGFDVGPATNVTVENVHVTNDDDCVVYKPGANYCAARSITCVGSHGLSVGSLGSSHGSNDTVMNSYFDGAVMVNSTKATGIKLYPGGPSYGTATVHNVTWKNIVCQGCDYSVQIQSCYPGNETYCDLYPSTAELTGISWQNVSGVTDGHYGSVVGNLDCPGKGTCGIEFEDLSTTAPDGKWEMLCANTPENIGVKCTTGASG